MSIKRINAIFIKEIQDMRTNWNHLLLYFIPLGITLVYCKLIPSDQMPKGMALSLGLLMLVIMAGISITAMMVAEEKEKRTLEVLLLSPATPKEIFFGKSMVTFISIIMCMFLLMLIDNNNWGSLPVIFVATTLISVFCIIIGLITGIFSKSQMSTGILGAPLMFLFLLPPMFSVMGLKQMDFISKAVPTYYYLDILKKVSYSKWDYQDMLFELGVLLGSIVIGAVLLLVIIRRKGLE